MVGSTASRTALGAAMHRAVHQLKDRPPVFEDPLALRIVGAEAEAELRSGRSRYFDARLAKLRAFIAIRSRFAEDCAAGAAQYVLLGAGLDTFAYRSRGVRVFEVDHPATQSWKRARLAATGIAVPAEVAFVAVDFERDDFVAGLRRAGFDFARRAVVAWLGVVPYLQTPTVLETLRELRENLAPGSLVIFDYPSSPSDLTEEERRAAVAFALRVASAGEPLRTFFDPRELPAELASIGLHGQDFNHVTLTACYLADRSDGLALSRHAHIMQASVPP